MGLRSIRIVGVSAFCSVDLFFMDGADDFVISTGIGGVVLDFELCIPLAPWQKLKFFVLFVLAIRIIELLR